MPKRLSAQVKTIIWRAGPDFGTLKLKSLYALSKDDQAVIWRRIKRYETGKKYVARHRALYRRHLPVLDRREIYARGKGKCYLCGQKVLCDKWEMDHVWPLSKGGEHSYRNIRVACSKCNKHKWTRIPVNFQFGLFD